MTFIPLSIRYGHQDLKGIETGEAALAHIVFIGAGHGHLPIIQSGKLQQAGHTLTLISPEDFYYSGLATGVLAGDYGVEQDRVNIAAFAAKYKVNYVRARVETLDGTGKTCSLDTGQTLSFDLASVAVGSVAQGNFSSEAAFAVKPVSSLLAKAEGLEGSLAIIGGGVAGCELALSIKSAKPQLKIALFTRHLIMGDKPHAREGVLEELEKAKVSVFEQSPVERLDGGTVYLANGDQHSFTSLLLATGLKAPEFLSRSDLATDEIGAVRVNAHLQSISHPHIFAIGDCMAYEGRKLDKAGVFAIRGAPILAQNLDRAAKGQPLKKYIPQTRYLWIMNLGHKRGLLGYGQFLLNGRLAWAIKDFIDLRFVKGLRP